MIALYYTRAAAQDGSFALLSDYRKKKISADKAAFQLCVEKLLIYALRSAGADITLPLDIQTGRHGKPYIPNLPFHFSISHSGELILVAVSDSEVGADIQEAVDYERGAKISARYFTEKERTRAIQDRSGREFTRIWTSKEAFCKYTGDGLGAILASMEADESKTLHCGSIGTAFYSVCTEEKTVPAPVFVPAKELPKLSAACFKLEIFIPESHFPALREALYAVDAGHIGNYDRCLSFSRVMSTWRPCEGTKPFSGSLGELSVKEELKVEVTVTAQRLKETLKAIKAAHPYEEPVINVIELHGTGLY